MPRTFGPSGSSQRSPTKRPANKGHTTVALSMALTLSVVGVVLLVAMLRDRPAAAEAELGGVSLRIQEAGWTQMDHLDGGGTGFQMPAAMMPGAPEPGKERLRVQVTLANRADAPRRVNGGEFRLEGADGARWPLQSETLGLDQLGPGLAVSGSLHFDVPVDDGASLADGSLRLAWEHAGKVVRLAVPAGAAPDHGGGGH